MIRLGHSLASLHATLHNGPGWRVPFWVQGCRLRCTERCLNPHYLSTGGGWEWAEEEVADALIDAAAAAAVPVEGVTVLGGEPMDQADAVAQVLHRVRGAGLSTMVYSGYTLSALHVRSAASLEAIDLLVDGPFIPARYDDTLAWRGSSNQRIHRLTPRYSERDLAEAFARQRKGFSLHVSADGAVTVSGLQQREGAERLERAVAGGGEGR